MKWVTGLWRSITFRGRSIKLPTGKHDAWLGEEMEGMAAEALMYECSVKEEK